MSTHSPPVTISHSKCCAVNKALVFCCGLLLKILLCAVNEFSNQRIEENETFYISELAALIAL